MSRFGWLSDKTATACHHTVRQLEYSIWQSRCPDQVMGYLAPAIITI